MIRALPLFPLLLLAALLTAGPGRVMAEAGAKDCRVPPELIDVEPRLNATGERLKAKQPIVIVAIGGASTAGTAAGDGAVKAYPHRLEEALRQRHPGVAITVLNKAVPRQTTAEMVARFASDVFPADPTLVIWETGTVDAVRGNDVDQFADALESGIAALREKNIDLILVNMQYNASLGSIVNFEPYLEAMRQAAELEDVYQFRRYEIMQYWSDNGVFDFTDVAKAERRALAQEVYRCLGDGLAEAIDDATR